MDDEFIWPRERLRELTAFKLTKSERIRLNLAAKKKGLSISEFVRQALKGVVSE